MTHDTTITGQGKPWIAFTTTWGPRILGKRNLRSWDEVHLAGKKRVSPLVEVEGAHVQRMVP